MRRFERDEEGVAVSVFADDNVVLMVCVGWYPDTLALTDGEVVKASVLTQRHVILCSNDWTWPVGDVLLQEVLHFDISDKADPLTVLFLCVGQI